MYTVVYICCIQKTHLCIHVIYTVEYKHVIPMGGGVFGLIKSVLMRQLLLLKAVPLNQVTSIYSFSTVLSMTFMHIKLALKSHMTPID